MSRKWEPGEEEAAVRTYVEEFLRGTEVEEIADVVGISRSTAYEWLERPEIQEALRLYGQEAMRAGARTFSKVFKRLYVLLDLQVQQAIDALRSGDPALIKRSHLSDPRQAMHILERLHQIRDAATAPADEPQSGPPALPAPPAQIVEEIVIPVVGEDHSEVLVASTSREDRS